MAAKTPRSWARVGTTVAYSAGTYDGALPTAMFDFDSTLRPYRGTGPPEGTTLAFLARLSDSFNIVIVSNRSSASAAALAPLREYVAMLDTGSSPGRATVYAPHARDRYRKPHTGTWEHFVAGPCGGTRPAFAFFCGDAAGRPGDHSAADYMYALNTGLLFVTAEALFGGSGGGTPWADPVSLGCTAGPPAGVEGASAADAAAAYAAEQALAALPEPCLVVMVGSPASGKSRVAARLVAERGLALVSGDAQGARHKQVFAAAFADRRSIVVDNTCPLAADRARFAGEAAARGYTVAICHVTTPKPLCFHLNAARCQLDAAGRTAELPPVVLHTYWKRLEPPTEKEAEAYGARLVRVPFALAAGAPPEVTRFRYPLA